MIAWKKWTKVVLIALAVATTSQVAQAKKLGGGGSFGFQKSSPYERKAAAPQAPVASKPAAAPATAPAKAAPSAASASGASKWLGPLAGIAAGGLIAAMLFGDGFDGMAFLDFMLLAALAFLAFKLIMGRRRAQSAEAAQDYAYAGRQSASQSEASPTVQPAVQAFKSDATAGMDVPVIGSGLSESARPVDAPQWFDAQAFASDAKGHFMSIQQAWDEGDTGRLAAFMTPELYAEMAQQLIARGDAENMTEVSELTCAIEETAQEGELFMVSLRFSGFVSEEGADEHSFQEVWHIQRPMDGTGRWQLAGIQQMS